MADDSHIDDEDDEPGFLRKFGVWIVVAIVLAGGAGAFVAFGKQDKKPVRAESRVTMVSLPPPPSPPPPPPPPPPEPQPREEQEPEDVEEEMIEQEAVTEPEPIAEPDLPPDEPMGTSVQGDGPPDGFGLSGSGSGMGIGGGGSRGGGGGGSRWGNFAAKVQSSVAQALRADKRTRSAAMTTEIRVWADSTGRIVRVTGGGAAAEVLKGLQLPEPPPADMPMPVVMRITAKRPN